MKTEQTKSLTEKIADKAAEFLDHFQCIKVDRSEEEIYTLKDQAPPSLKDLVREAHGDFLPDDFRYETIQDALCALSDGLEDLDEVRLEADIYHHDLLKWLSSNLKRIAYCDEAKEEFGLQEVDLMTLITYGQLREKEEILASVRESLIQICEEEELEESE